MYCRIATLNSYHWICLDQCMLRSSNFSVRIHGHYPSQLQQNKRINFEVRIIGKTQIFLLFWKFMSALIMVLIVAFRCLRICTIAQTSKFPPL